MTCPQYCESFPIWILWVVFCHLNYLEMSWILNRHRERLLARRVKVFCDVTNISPHHQYITISPIYHHITNVSPIQAVTNVTCLDHSLMIRIKQWQSLFKSIHKVRQMLLSLNFSTLPPFKRIIVTFLAFTIKKTFALAPWI